ncbi:MAG: Crp/Fnr family transcriptional regulator [Caulobacterales bacterium]
MEDYAAERFFVAKGKHLVVEGARNPSVFLQLTGWASAECLTLRGDRVLMDFLTAGDFVGLADDGPHAALTVTALTDLVALRIERVQLQALMERDQRVREVCFAALKTTLARTRNMRMALSAKSGASKVCQVLSDLGERVETLSENAANSIVRPKIPISQVSLAHAIGLTPVAVNRIVQTLRQAGLLEWGVAGVSILDVRRLRSYA